MHLENHHPKMGLRAAGIGYKSYFRDLPQKGRGDRRDNVVGDLRVQGCRRGKLDNKVREG